MLGDEKLGNFSKLYSYSSTQCLYCEGTEITFPFKRAMNELI